MYSFTQENIMVLLYSQGSVTSLLVEISFLLYYIPLLFYWSNTKTVYAWLIKLDNTHFHYSGIHKFFIKNSITLF
jgi:hypothetical protein